MEEAMASMWTPHPHGFMILLFILIRLLGLTDLHLDEAGLFWERAGQNPRVTEAGSEQHRHDEEKEDRRKHGDGRRQVDSQVRASVGRKHLNQRDDQ